MHASHCPYYINVFFIFNVNELHFQNKLGTGRIRKVYKCTTFIYPLIPFAITDVLVDLVPNVKAADKQHAAYSQIFFNYVKYKVNMHMY